MNLLVAAHDFYPDPGSGGTGRYVYETTRRLADRGHDVSVLTRRRGDVPLRETVAGVRVARYDLAIADRLAPEIAAQLPGAAKTVRDHLDALPDPHLVSFQGTVTDPLLDLFVPDDVPTSATFHSPWSTEYRIRASHEQSVSAPRRRLNAALRRLVERKTLADCEQVVALSRFMAGKLREVHGQLADLEIVPGGVDADRYRPDAGHYEPMRAVGEGGPVQKVGGGEPAREVSECEPVREADECEPVPAADERGPTGAVEADGGDATAFLTVRRLSPRMGHGTLLRAFTRVASDRPGTHLYIAGDGPLRDELEQQAAELGIADRVTFLGYVPDEDLPSAYATADCFVLPTTKLEGFGLATLEALASGTPVVATPVGGTTEILSGLEARTRIPTEMVVSSVDSAALAERLIAWAELDSEARETAGRACREYVRENYTWDRTADALERRYEALLGDRESGDLDRVPKRDSPSVPRPQD